MSPRTLQAHLTHVSCKLDLGSRVAPRQRGSTTRPTPEGRPVSIGHATGREQQREASRGPGRYCGLGQMYINVGA
ncbi:MAG: hypothetical protein ACRDZ3_12500 [Acidimicrobiia bacterium]